MGSALITTDVVNRDFSTSGWPLQQSSRHRLSRQPGLLGLQCADGRGALSDQSRHAAGLLHLEPHHRQPERSVDRRLLQSDFHQHSKPAKRRSARSTFSDNSIRNRGSGQFRFRSAAESGDLLVLESASALREFERGILLRDWTFAELGRIPLRIALHLSMEPRAPSPARG